MNNTSNKVVGEGVKFERIRRITGYLVGTLDQNHAAQAPCFSYGVSGAIATFY